jgi:hypothetical protein
MYCSHVAAYLCIFMHLTLLSTRRGVGLIALLSKIDLRQGLRSATGRVNVQVIIKQL